MTTLIFKDSFSTRSVVYTEGEMIEIFDDKQRAAFARGDLVMTGIGPKQVIWQDAIVAFNRSLDNTLDVDGTFSYELIIEDLEVVLVRRALDVDEDADDPKRAVVFSATHTMEPQEF